MRIPIRFQELKKRKTFQREGNALVITILTGAVFGFLLISYLGMISTEFRLIQHSMDWNGAVPIAEAGIEEALTHLQTSSSLFGTNGWSISGSNYEKGRAWNAAGFQALITTSMPPVITVTGMVTNTDGAILKRTIRVMTTNSSSCVAGMISKENISMNGTIVCDSYDSSDTAYSTNGRYDSLKYKDNAVLGVVTGAIDAKGSKIYGSVMTSPTKTVTGGSIGDKAFVNSGAQGIEPGHWRNDFNYAFPPADPPPAGGLFPTSGKIGANSYDYVLNGKNYEIPGDLLMSGKSSIGVSGNCVLYIRRQFKMTGQSFIYIAPGASLTIYAGGDVDLAGQGIQNTDQDASKLKLYGVDSCGHIDIGGNASYTGTIYAPAAELKLHGGGKDPYDLCGAAVVRDVAFDGHYNFHYDERLGKTSTGTGYTVTSWLEL